MTKNILDTTIQHRDHLFLTNNNLQNSKIIGGKNTTIDQYPWQASLMFMGKHFCGATIIGKNKLLTAVHCVRAMPLLFMQIRVGSTYANEGGITYNASKVIEHDDANIPVFNNNGLAIVFLARNLTFQINVQAIPLPKQDASPPEAGTMAMMSGWGALYDNGPNIDQLQCIKLPIVDSDACDQAIGIIRETMICAGRFDEGGADSCRGDHGGPLIIDGMLQGIMSWGRGCGQPKRPGVYVRVAYYRDWIDSVV